MHDNTANPATYQPHSPADSGTIEAALAHAAAGRPVFPCGADKKALVKEWQHVATTDPEKIRYWWRTHPGAVGIGMPTGPKSGVLVLDVDSEAGHGVDGDESLSALLREHGEIPESVEVLTPSGGRHLWFRYPEGAEIRNSAGRLGAGLDVRGDGGYVLLPGSGVNGHRYEFEGSSDPDEGAQIAEPPGWLVDLATSRARSTEPPEDTEPEIPEGQRNDRLASLGGAMRRAGLEVPEIADALLIANQSRCKPPLPRAEVLQIAESVGRYAKGSVPQTLDWLFRDVPDSEPAKADSEHGKGVPSRAELVPSPEEIAGAALAPTCIVRDYLYADVAQIIAPGGTGKTTLLLHEAAHIALGRPVWGLEVPNPGWTLFVTAEDNRERLIARLRHIVDAMDLSAEECDHVFGSVLFWDVTGLSSKLVRAHDGNIDVTMGAQNIAERHQDDPPAVLVFDPLVSFGASEAAVNDNEQALITAARRLVRALGCCVRYVHHTGKANARNATTDQYSGRGGSALADGSRMTAVLHGWTPAHPDPLPEPWLPHPERAVLMLDRPKLSYSPPNRPRIWIRRHGFRFTHLIEDPATAAPPRHRHADALEQFLAVEAMFAQIPDGGEVEPMAGYWTKRRLENSEAAQAHLGMTRDQIRAAVDDLIGAGQIVSRDLPPGLRQGRRTEFLFPVRLEAWGDD